jgi:hypothetical protein
LPSNLEVAMELDKIAEEKEGRLEEPLNLHEKRSVTGNETTKRV